MNCLTQSSRGAGHDPRRAIDKFGTGKRARVASNSAIPPRLKTFSESLRARVNGFRRTVEHSYGLEENRIDEIEAILLPLLCGARLRSFDTNKALRNLNPVNRRRDVFSTLVPKRYQGSKLLGLNCRDAIEIRLNNRDDPGASINHQRLRNSDLYRANRANSYSEACIYAGRADARSAEFIFAFASLIGVGYVESHDHGAARPNRGCDIPEVLRRSGCLRDDRPYAEYGQKTDCDQQPNECELSDFPCAFHDSPVFDFGAIVARPTEGA